MAIAMGIHVKPPTWAVITMLTRKSTLVPLMIATLLLIPTGLASGISQRGPEPLSESEEKCFSRHFYDVLDIAQGTESNSRPGWMALVEGKDVKAGEKYQTQRIIAETDWMPTSRLSKTGIITSYELLHPDENSYSKAYQVEFAKVERQRFDMQTSASGVPVPEVQPYSELCSTSGGTCTIAVHVHAKADGWFVGGVYAFLNGLLGGAWLHAEGNVEVSSEVSCGGDLVHKWEYGGGALRVGMNTLKRATGSKDVYGCSYVATPLVCSYAYNHAWSAEAHVPGLISTDVCSKGEVNNHLVTAAGSIATGASPYDGETVNEFADSAGLSGNYDLIPPEDMNSWLDCHYHVETTLDDAELAMVLDMMNQ